MQDRRAVSNMPKNHLKRIAMPKSWPLERKGANWVIRSNPGPHSLATSMPLGLIIREMLGYSKTNSETKKITNFKHVLVNGMRRKDHRFPVGLFDVLSLPDVNENYRLSLDHNGKLILIPIKKEEANTRLLRIKGKTRVAGKTQLNFFDGTNILSDKEGYKIGDCVTIEKDKVADHLKFEKGATVFLTGGAHISEVGTVESVEGNKVRFKSKEGIVETLKDYAFVVGKEKPLITVRR